MCIFPRSVLRLFTLKVFLDNPWQCHSEWGEHLGWIWSHLAQWIPLLRGSQRKPSKQPPTALSCLGSYLLHPIWPWFAVKRWARLETSPLLQASYLLTPCITQCSLFSVVWNGSFWCVENGLLIETLWSCDISAPLLPIATQIVPNWFPLSVHDFCPLFRGWSRIWSGEGGWKHIGNSKREMVIEWLHAFCYYQWPHHFLQLPVCYVLVSKMSRQTKSY